MKIWPITPIKFVSEIVYEPLEFALVGILSILILDKELNWFQILDPCFVSSIDAVLLETVYLTISLLFKVYPNDLLSSSKFLE